MLVPACIAYAEASVIGDIYGLYATIVLVLAQLLSEPIRYGYMNGIALAVPL